ncbi:hypothetical protein NYR30_01610 [Gallibacterium salpingitidis]|uniref:DNA-3-methyladenine glycosylase family protein n=1 Tax=Gallibacterium salpingitidis TaxID=505341 RepID=UPI00266FE99D|nr:hypothetical protein [Gallibacterium salpingitidis]WKT00027.1 hypothetical protein NYR30_01610 [Gallibacterium salpingitidis]
MTTQNFPNYEEGIIFLKRQDKQLAWLIEQIGYLTHTDTKDDFLFLLEQIIGQMLSIKVADVMLERLTDICGGIVTVESINQLDIETLRNIGISNRKAVCIKEIAQMIANGSLDFRTLKALPDNQLIKCLTTIKGIGSWTAKMYLYKIHRPDVLPYEDATFLSAYKWLYQTQEIRPAAIKQHCKKWSPYLSIAAMYLYAAFERKLLQTEVPKY